MACRLFVVMGKEDIFNRRVVGGDTIDIQTVQLYTGMYVYIFAGMYLRRHVYMCIAVLKSPLV